MQARACEAALLGAVRANSGGGREREHKGARPKGTQGSGTAYAMRCPSNGGQQGLQLPGRQRGEGLGCCGDEAGQLPAADPGQSNSGGSRLRGAPVGTPSAWLPAHCLGAPRRGLHVAHHAWLVPISTLAPSSMKT